MPPEHRELLKIAADVRVTAEAARPPAAVPADREVTQAARSAVLHISSFIVILRRPGRVTSYQLALINSTFYQL
jgi:hypothetical protein